MSRIFYCNIRLLILTDNYYFGPLKDMSFFLFSDYFHISTDCKSTQTINTLQLMTHCLNFLHPVHLDSIFFSLNCDSNVQKKV